MLTLLLGGNPGDLTNLVGIAPPTSDSNTGEISDLAAECQTGADANARQDCAIVGYVNSIQAFWTDEFASQGVEYTSLPKQCYSQGQQKPLAGTLPVRWDRFIAQPTRVFTWTSPSLMNSQTRFGAQGGPFAMAYVLAHEYGHHIQDLLGLLDTSGSSKAKVRRASSVFTELQADCLAGVWVYNAVETGYLSQVTSAGDSPKPWMPRSPWETTGSSSKHKATFRPRPGRMDLPNSGRRHWKTVCSQVM